MDFIYLSRVLLKRKWIIIGAAILAAVIAYFLTGNEPKKYKSTAQISTGYTITDDIKVNDKEVSFFEADTKFNNAIVTFTSPTVINLLSYSLILHDLTSPSPFYKLTDQEKQTDAYKQVNKDQAKKVFADKLDSMSLLTSYKPDEKKLLELLKLYGYDYKTINNNLSVYRVQRTDYIQIDYTSENPELSSYVVNNIFQQFLHYYGNVRSVKSTESIDTLKSLVDKKKQIVDQKNQLLQAKGIAINVDDKSTGTFEQIALLQGSLTEEENKKTELGYTLQKINQKLNNLPSGTAARNSNNEQILMAKNARNDAYKEYLNSGKTDKALFDKYNRLQEEYVRLTSQDNGDNGSSVKPGEDKNDLLVKKNDAELDIQASNKKISDLKTRINFLQSSIQRDASKSAEDQALIKDAELATTEYLDAKKKYSDAMDINSSAVNNFRQVLLGQPAIEPEPSKRKVIVALAGAAALITTMLIIIFLAYLDSSIKTPAIFSKTVNLKLISMVNFMNLKNKSLADIVANRDVGDDPTDRTRNNKFRESLRKLRYEIETSGKKIFLFTSTKKGQGKTTLIQALSYSMSLSKKKILIIDTNFCNNDLTVQLNAEPILEKIVPYKADSEALLEQVKVFSKDVGVGSIFAIGAEGGDYTPSEILPRENLLQHLHSLTSEFDYIFLEGPPLNDFSDSKELAQYVDGVIAVFSATHIIKQIDKQSISFFKELNGKFCGSILNMVDLKNVNVA